MASPAALWAPSQPWAPAPIDPPFVPGPAGLVYEPWTAVVLQHADWTCSCASASWLLNSILDNRLGRDWNEWDAVEALRNATYPGAVDPSYGLARADMVDLQTMFNGLGYAVERRLGINPASQADLIGLYPVQMNGARWGHHTGVREYGPGSVLLANPAPTWRGVGQDLDSAEAATWGPWNVLAIKGRL